jgi:hypothetical protein
MERRFAAVLLSLLSSALGAASFYVSPGGSDSAAGSLAAPFQTLAKAAAVAQAGDTVFLRQGVYRETLNATRSGTASAPIIFQGYPCEDAILAGSDLVTGAWSVDSGNVWRIDGLPATINVFVDGQEMPEARWPNITPGAAMNAGWATAASGSNSTTLVDPNLPSVNLTGAQVRIIPGAAWVAYSRTVTAYANGQFTFSSSVGPNASYWPKAGNQYYLFRHRALLDAPGEWFQDPSTNRLYLWLPDSGSPSSHQIEIAARKDVVYVNGQSYLQFKDFFTFSGAIDLNASNGSKVLGVDQRYVHHRSDVDGYNFELTHNQINGGSGCEWSGGSIWGSSGDGLYVAGTGHTVQNMVIHDVDQIGTYRGAVRMAGSGHTITQNSFYDSGRFLIFHDQAKGGSLTYNHLYNAGLLTSDMGATYCYRCNGGGMVIAYNHVHDVHCSVGAGIYLDNGGSNFVIHHNLVHNVDWFALKLNLPSYDNTVVNNTLFATKYWVNAAGSQYPQEMTGTTLVNNLYSGGAQLITGAMGPTLIANGTYTAPPAIFNSGAWTLAPGSPAIDKGVVYAPYTNGYCGAAPDQGCFESGCGNPWSAGSTQVPPPFPYPLPTAGSPTPSATRTQTPGISPSKSPSVTPSATRSNTASPSPSATGTLTPSATPTPTRSSTALATASASPTLSATLTVTGSATASATATVSLTRSPIPSSSATPTAVARSATPSVSPSESASGTASPSATGTVSGTSTVTLSTTATATPSSTSSASASPSATLSATPNASPSLSVTASSTASSSATPSVSASPSASSSATPSSSPSATLSASLSATPSPSPSATLSASPSSTSSATPTSTPSSQASPSATRTPSGTPSPSGTRTPTMPSETPSLTLTPATTPTPAPPGDGPLRLREAVALPNPVGGQHLRLRYFSESAAPLLQVQVFSAASTCVLAQELPGPSASGWAQAELSLPGLAPGYYSARLRLRDGARLSDPRRLKLWVLP